MGDIRDFGRRMSDEVLNGRNVDLIDDIMSDDYVDHSLPPGVPPTRAGLKQVLSMLLGAFPDLHYTVSHSFHDGDHFIHHVEATGTQTGEMMGMPPSGRKVSWAEIHIGRVAGGRIVEHWGVVDVAAIMAQSAPLEAGAAPA